MTRGLIYAILSTLALILILWGVIRLSILYADYSYSDRVVSCHVLTQVPHSK